MANSIKFMNEGFEAKYGDIKPDLCEQIYTVLKRLTEANRSPEDEEDTKLLYSIYDKKMENGNAKLSPEEKAVLKKYNVYYPTLDKEGNRRIIKANSKDFYVPGVNLFEPLNKDNQPNRNVNLADRARKMTQRAQNSRTIGKYDKDYKRNYDSMQRAIRNRDWSEHDLNNIDREYEEREKQLRQELNNLEKDKLVRKERAEKNNTLSKFEINRLLKRESLLSEDGGYDDYYGGNKDDFISDLNDVEKALDSVYDSLATHRAQQLVDDFLYDIEIKRRKAGKI